MRAAKSPQDARIYTVDSNEDIDQSVKDQVTDIGKAQEEAPTRSPDVPIQASDQPIETQAPASQSVTLDVVLLIVGIVVILLAIYVWRTRSRS